MPPQEVDSHAHSNPSHLCHSCQGLFTGTGAPRQVDKGYIHSPNLSAISSNAAAGCALCAWMEATCRGRYKALKSTPVIFRMQDDKSRYQLYGKCGSMPLEYGLVPLRTAQNLLRWPDGGYHSTVIEETNNSEHSRSLASAWINCCLATHDGCRRASAEPYWIPRRLVEIDRAQSRSTIIRIVDREFITGEIAYIALSHRWGDAMVLTLNSQTMVELRSGVPAERLPLSFQDAIQVCQWFEIRYLWIDSLCIIQDSEDDWLAESHTMKSVYTKAAFTIAAGAGTSDVGLFVHRRQNAVTAPQVESTWTSHRNDSYCIVDCRLWMRGVDAAPLSKRAWVVQERFLSSRVLFFGATQMFYECCEASPKKLGHVSVKSAPMKAWHNAAKAYSEASLTKYSDKLIAVAGLAQMCQEKLNDEYVVGLWKKRLVAQLCWETQAFTHLRPDPCLAPTWSWLSVNGGLRLDELFEPVGQPLVQVTQICIDLVDPASPTGQIRSATLRVRCQLKPVSWIQNTKYGKTDFRRYQLACDGIEYGMQAFSDNGRKFFTNVDVLPTSELLDTTAYLMPVTKVKYGGGTEQLKALVLKKRAGDGDLFERIGIIAIGPVVAKQIFRETQAEVQTLTGVLEGVLRYLSLSDDPLPTSRLCEEITLV